MGQEKVTKVQEAQSPIQDKPNTNTNINQTDKNKRKKILKATREKQQITYREIPLRLNSSGQKRVVEYI